MAKNKKLYNVCPPDEKNRLPISPADGKSRLPITHVPAERVVLGMTYIRLNGNYGIDDFSAQNRKRTDRNLYDEFRKFQKDVGQYPDITAFMKAYSPKNGQPSGCDFQRQELIRLKETYNIDEDMDHIRHIHAKPHGNGQTVLWGLVRDNVFEILAIDTEHKTI